MGWKRMERGLTAMLYEGKESDVDFLLKAKEFRYPLKGLYKRYKLLDINIPIDLSNSDLRFLNATNFSAKNSNFNDVDLRFGSIHGGDLSGSSFRGANLSGAFFSNCNLSGVDFTGVTYRDLTILSSNLTGCTLPVDFHSRKEWISDISLERLL